MIWSDMHKAGHPWGMSNWMLITRWPINTGLTDLTVYQENEDGDKARYP